MGLRDVFEADVMTLYETKDLPPYAVRKEQLEGLTEWYFDVFGKHYNNTFYLDLLGSYLLADELRDKSVYKVKNAEYPVLSYTQLKLRNRRESRVGDENLDFIKLKVVDNAPNSFRKKTQNKEET